LKQRVIQGLIADLMICMVVNHYQLY